MTKAEKIRRTAKAHPDWGCTRIGRACDCTDSYVRVVLRQRVVNGQSDIDRRWRAKFKAQHGLTPNGLKYRTDPEFRQKSIDAVVKWTKENPERRAKIARDYYYRAKAKREAAHA